MLYEHLLLLNSFGHWAMRKQVIIRSQEKNQMFHKDVESSI